MAASRVIVFSVGIKVIIIASTDVILVLVYMDMFLGNDLKNEN